MEMSSFKYIWEQGIAKAANDVLDSISPDLREKYLVDIDISDTTREKVCAEYDKIRVMVRTKYFDTGKNDENRIDGHKICACITGALLNIRLINYKIFDGEMPNKIVFANYEIAFLAGIYVMYLFLLSDYERDNELECYEELKEQSTFIFPETNPGHDPYVLGRIKTLALNDLNGNDFDILTYADMLFWIERYNKELIHRKLQIKNKEVAVQEPVARLNGQIFI